MNSSGDPRIRRPITVSRLREFHRGHGGRRIPQYEANSEEKCFLQAEDHACPADATRERHFR